MSKKLLFSLALWAFTQLWADGIWATDLSIPDTYTLTNPYTGPVSVTDSGVTSGNNYGAAIENYGSTTTIENSGYVRTSNNYGFGLGIYNVGTINTLTNNGTINGNGDGIDIYNDYGGTINTLTNNGTITGNIYGIFNGGTINTLTNNGTITGNSYGIFNGGTITTLNNAQGGTATHTSNGNALTYSGTSPQNYNIIITSTTSYGQLINYSSTGSMAFGISVLSTKGASILSNYSTVLNGITSVNLGYGGATTSGIQTSNGYTYTLIETGASTNIWDLDLLSAPSNGPTSTDTQASLAQSAQALRGVYDLQNVSINNNLNNDCNLFDVHGICTSVTGTQNYLSGGVNNDTTSGTLTFAYRVNDHVRIGAYLDQNLNTSNVTGLHLNNGSPAFGAFAVWNANADGLGTQLRVSAGYADKDLTVTRSAVQTSEAGSGTTSLNSYGASIVGSYAMAMPGDFIFSPYAGIRYTRVSADGYTEQANVNVTDPLTYSALTQNATTALVGTKWTRHIADNAVAYASIGLEQDLSNNGGTYSASSANIAGLTPIAFNPNINHTRPTASIGSYYNLGNTQRIAANLVWGEEAFTTANATSLMITYTAGF